MKGYASKQYNVNVYILCYFTLLCTNLSKCNFDFVMKFIRAETKYNLLGMHFQVVFDRFCKPYRHFSNCIQHLHVPLYLIIIMLQNQCPFKYFDNIHVEKL